MLWVALFAAALYFGIIQLVTAAREKKLIKNGEISKREKRFWKKEEVISTLVSPEVVKDSFDQLDTSPVGVSKYIDKDEMCGYIFQSNDIRNGLFEARMKSKGEEGIKYVYGIRFTSWRTKSFVVQGQIRMNRLLTLIENTFCELDPETVIELRKVEK